MCVDFFQILLQVNVCHAMFGIGNGRGGGKGFDLKYEVMLNTL